MARGQFSSESVTVARTRAASTMRRGCVLLGTVLFLAVLPPIACAQVRASEKPDAALTPVGALGDISEIEKRVLFFRLQSELSKHYRLVPQEEYARAEERAFRELEAAKCTEEQCIRRIQDILQVERLFVLQVIRERTFTQIVLTLVRRADKIVRDDTCESCSIAQLHGRVEALVGQLALADPGTPQPAIAQAGQAPAAEPRLRSRWPLWTGWVLLATSAGAYATATASHDEARKLAASARETDSASQYEAAIAKQNDAKSYTAGAQVAAGLGVLLLGWYWLSGPPATSAVGADFPPVSRHVGLALAPGSIRVGWALSW